MVLTSNGTMCEIEHNNYIIMTNMPIIVILLVLAFNRFAPSINAVIPAS